VRGEGEGGFGFFASDRKRERRRRRRRRESGDIERGLIHFGQSVHTLSSFDE